MATMPARAALSVPVSTVALPCALREAIANFGAGNWRSVAARNRPVAGIKPSRLYGVSCAGKPAARR